jgi:hypothetical protein
MRKSKYFGYKNGEWVCTHVGISRVQPAFKKGTRIRAKRPGHRSYYYVFERLTHDGKAEKMIRLTAAQAKLVYDGVFNVEYYADLFKTKQNPRFVEKVSYSFCDGGLGA